jgi:hypothetical protein
MTNLHIMSWTINFKLMDNYGKHQRQLTFG